jgi:hypothetical protein
MDRIAVPVSFFPFPFLRQGSNVEYLAKHELTVEEK